MARLSIVLLTISSLSAQDMSDDEFIKKMMELKKEQKIAKEKTNALDKRLKVSKQRLKASEEVLKMLGANKKYEKTTKK